MYFWHPLCSPGHRRNRSHAYLPEELDTRVDEHTTGTGVVQTTELFLPLPTLSEEGWVVWVGSLDASPAPEFPSRTALYPTSNCWVCSQV